MELRYAQDLVDKLYEDREEGPSPLHESGDDYRHPFSGYMTCVRGGTENYVVAAEGDRYGDDAIIRLKRFDLMEGMWFLTQEDYTRCLIGKPVDGKMLRRMLQDMMHPEV